MSALENGLLVNIDNKTKGLQTGIDNNIAHAAKFGRDITTAGCNSGHSKSCNGSKNAELVQAGLDADPEPEDISPDISLSSQKTLRYCDVEQDVKDHFNSHSSDSLDTLDEHPKKIVSRDSIGSSDNQESQQINQGSSNTATDSIEVIPEFSNVVPRPESLSLSHPLQDIEQEQNKSDSNTQRCKNVETDITIKDSSKIDQPVNAEDPDTHLIDSDICLAQNLPQGTITRKGDMIQFVADDLMEKIKKSSPMSHTDTASNGSRRSSVRSTASASSSTSFATSSGVSRSPSSLCQQSPDDIPPIDASAVIELENHARRVADSLDLMMGNIRNNLHKMSAITIGCQDAYKRSVDITCDSVDASIKAMYALMAKCEELSRSMKPVDQLAVQIREIKRILDLFEAQMVDK